jgi:hypothetical protein
MTTICWVLYCINIAHSANYSQAGLGSGQSNEQQLSDKMMTLYIKHTCIIFVITVDKVAPTVSAALMLLQQSIKKQYWVY